LNVIVFFITLEIICLNTCEFRIIRGCIEWSRWERRCVLNVKLRHSRNRCCGHGSGHENICWKASIKKYLPLNFHIDSSSSHGTTFDWVKARYSLKSDNDYPKIQQVILIRIWAILVKSRKFYPKSFVWQIFKLFNF
jgi:hypothetical protein